MSKKELPDDSDNVHPAYLLYKASLTETNVDKKREITRRIKWYEDHPEPPSPLQIKIQAGREKARLRRIKDQEDYELSLIEAERRVKEIDALVAKRTKKKNKNRLKAAAARGEIWAMSTKDILNELGRLEESKTLVP